MAWSTPFAIWRGLSPNPCLRASPTGSTSTILLPTSTEAPSQARPRSHPDSGATISNVPIVPTTVPASTWSPMVNCVASCPRARRRRRGRGYGHQTAAAPPQAEASRHDERQHRVACHMRSPRLDQRCLRSGNSPNPITTGARPRCTSGVARFRIRASTRMSGRTTPRTASIGASDTGTARPQRSIKEWRLSLEPAWPRHRRVRLALKRARPRRPYRVGNVRAGLILKYDAMTSEK